MGLQKYRADIAGDKQQNGATPYYTRWMGGPSLALIRECPVDNDPTLAPRTVYIKDHDYYEASCRVRGKTVHGWITCDSNREYVFRRRLPWLTGRAYSYLTDTLRHNRAVLNLLTSDTIPDEVRAAYERKIARLENAIAGFAARVVKRSK